MKPHAFANIIGAFTEASVTDPQIETVQDAEDPPSLEEHPQQTIATKPKLALPQQRWAQVKDGVGQGQRHTAAAVMAGKLLSDLSGSLWSTAFWPAMEAWNRKNKPPLSNAELKQIGEGILKLEQAKIALAKQEKKEQSGTDEEEPSLLELISDDNCRPFHDQHNEPHAHVLVKDHWETMRVNSRPMKRWLSMLAWRAEIVLNQEEINSTILHLEARAVHDGSQFPLETRIKYLQGENAILYDLSDPLWRAMRITPKGYSIVSEPGIHFRRFSHQERQVDPVEGGDLRELLTLTNLANEDQKLLFLVHLVSCLIPSIPHVIPNYHGPQGSAKTTLAKMVRALIDPSSMGPLSFPDNARELIQVLSHHYMVFFDNVSSITVEQSNTICRAVTGEATSKRQLWTDDEDVIYSFRRCAGFTGINPTARNPDLLDRSILIGLERIPKEKRREERLVLEEFEAMRPRLVGAMFTVLSKAMAIYPEIQLTEMSRMADFCRWGCAITRALGYDVSDFQRIYSANIKEQHEEAIQGSQLATAVRAFMQVHVEGWKGRPSALLQALTTTAEEEKLDVNARDWPKRANRLSSLLNESKTNLLEIGIKVESMRETGGGRLIELTVVPHGLEASHSDAVDAVTVARDVFKISPDIATSSTHKKTVSESQNDDGDDSVDKATSSLPF